MEYEIVTRKEMITAGISARTGNHAPEMMQVIGKLWNRFFNEGMYEAIPGKVNGRALGIYTDYAGHEKSEYTVLTACEVEREPAGEEFAVCRIPAGRYARVTVKGEVHQAVAQGWEEIGRMDLPRAFLCDFEEYMDSQTDHAKIHIYIGLRDV